MPGSTKYLTWRAKRNPTYLNYLGLETPKDAHDMLKPVRQESPPALLKIKLALLTLLSTISMALNNQRRIPVYGSQFCVC